MKVLTGYLKTVSNVVNSEYSMTTLLAIRLKKLEKGKKIFKFV